MLTYHTFFLPYLNVEHNEVMRFSVPTPRKRVQESWKVRAQHALFSDCRLLLSPGGDTRSSGEGGGRRYSYLFSKQLTYPTQ